MRRHHRGAPMGYFPLGDCYPIQMDASLFGVLPDSPPSSVSHFVTSHHSVGQDAQDNHGDTSLLSDEKHSSMNRYLCSGSDQPDRVDRQ